MKNIIKDIEKNCEDKSVEGIIRFLQVNGDLPFTSDHYREIWFFYCEALDMLKSIRKANKLTTEIMKITPLKLRRIKKRFTSRS